MNDTNTVVSCPDSSDARPLWPLPGTGAGRSAFWLSGILLALVAISRVGLLPDGPWEQDEAIFASGVLDFDVPAHRPHPPAFPGFVIMGKLVHLFVGDALLSLRLVSSACSVGTLILLAGLLQRFGLRGGIALAGALFYCLLPGVWAHSGRAFSTTPSLFFMLLSLWCFKATPRTRRFAYVGWISLAWALAVRPQLAVVAPLFLVVTVRERWWTSVQGWGPPAAALGLAGVIGGWVVWDSGGIGLLANATRTQAGRHFGAVPSRSLADLSELGFVRGLSGLAGAAAWLAASLCGAFVVAKRVGTSEAVWLLSVSAVIVMALLFLHDPYLPRYSPLFYLSTLPLAVHAVAAIAGRWALPTVALASLLTVLTSLPPVLSMSRGPLPVVAALRDLSMAGDDSPLVYPVGLFSFVRLEQDLGHVRSEGHIVPPLAEVTEEVLAGMTRATQPFLWLDSEYLVLPGLTIQRRVYDDFPPEAWDLSQRRFQSLQLIRNQPVWLRGRYATERTPWGEAFAWLSPRSAIWLQPGSRGLRLSLAIPARLHDTQAIVISAGGRELLRRELSESRADLTVAVDDCQRGCTLDLQFADSFVDSGGDRRLSARVEATWLDGFPLAAYRLSPGRLGEASALGARLSGFHGPELLEAGRPAAWTKGEARMEFPGTDGRLLVAVANPFQRAGTITLRSSVETRECPAGSLPTVCELRVRGDGETVWFEISSATFQPAIEESDDRVLGVAVYEVAFQPSAHDAVFRQSDELRIMAPRPPLRRFVRYLLSVLWPAWNRS